jgi:hypothetical protein
MCAIECEARSLMVKRAGFPHFSSMAYPAIGHPFDFKLPVMNFFMTRVTLVVWCSEYNYPGIAPGLLLMTLQTTDLSMLPFQLKVRLAMIESD